MVGGKTLEEGCQFFFGGGTGVHTPENASMLKVPYIEITCELIIVFEKIA
jgi:hypothetical protein